MEEQCENLYDKLEVDINYVPSVQELNSKKELIDYYLDPQISLERNFK